jgi:hypothetical protein
VARILLNPCVLALLSSTYSIILLPKLRKKLHILPHLIHTLPIHIPDPTSPHTLLFHAQPLTSTCANTLPTKTHIHQHRKTLQHQVKLSIQTHPIDILALTSPHTLLFHAQPTHLHMHKDFSHKKTHTATQEFFSKNQVKLKSHTPHRYPSSHITTYPPLPCSATHLHMHKHCPHNHIHTHTHHHKKKL